MEEKWRRKIATLLPQCNECGVKLQPVEIQECLVCGGGTLVLECPSCLDREEFTVCFDEDACLAGYRHIEHDGYWVSSEKMDVFVRSRK
jgi:hypothetical protein